MHRQVMWTTAVAWVALGLTAAAGEGVAVIRGQSPAMMPAGGPVIGSAPGYGQHSKHNKHHDFMHVYDHNFGYDHGYYTPRKHGYHGEACPTDPHCPPGHHGCPHHYQTQSYKWPQNMVYPPNVMPAGMVQYPYYTLRGPTDFFMK
jgi:hypothetical protein